MLNVRLMIIAGMAWPLAYYASLGYTYLLNQSDEIRATLILFASQHWLVQAPASFLVIAIIVEAFVCRQRSVTLFLSHVLHITICAMLLHVAITFIGYVSTGYGLSYGWPLTSNTTVALDFLPGHAVGLTPVAITRMTLKATFNVDLNLIMFFILHNIWCLTMLSVPAYIAAFVARHLGSNCIAGMAVFLFLYPVVLSSFSCWSFVAYVLDLNMQHYAFMVHVNTVQIASIVMLVWYGNLRQMVYIMRRRIALKTQET